MLWGPSRHLESLTAANWVSFNFNVSYSSCWGYSLINTFKLKKKNLLPLRLSFERPVFRHRPMVVGVAPFWVAPFCAHDDPQTPHTHIYQVTWQIFHEMDPVRHVRQVEPEPDSSSFQSYAWVDSRSVLPVFLVLSCPSFVSECCTLRLSPAFCVMFSMALLCIITMQPSECCLTRGARQAGIFFVSHTCVGCMVIDLAAATALSMGVCTGMWLWRSAMLVAPCDDWPGNKTCEVRFRSLSRILSRVALSCPHLWLSFVRFAATAAGGPGASAVSICSRSRSLLLCLALPPPLLSTCFARPYSQNLDSALWHLPQEGGAPPLWFLLSLSLSLAFPLLCLALPWSPPSSLLVLHGRILRIWVQRYGTYAGGWGAPTRSDTRSDILVPWPGLWRYRFRIEKGFWAAHVFELRTFSTLAPWKTLRGWAFWRLVRIPALL